MRKLLLLFVVVALGALSAKAQTSSEMILDFEMPETSTTFQYFGSTLDPTLNRVIANPDMSGINVSDSVAELVKPIGSQVWAGAYSNPNPQRKVDLTNLDQTEGSISMKVWAPSAVNVLFKLENNGVNGNAWEKNYQLTTAGAWEEISVNPFENGDNDAGAAPPAAGFNWNRVVVFMDFDQDTNTVEQVYYFDDIQVNGILPSDSITVDFAVDMNEYGAAFTQPYVSGEFNGWNGTANPLADGDSDGIWTASVRMLQGTYEYKFQVDDWSDDEKFNGTEVCTISDPSGQFVNRVGTWNADTALTQVLWGSCYAAGEGATITINLGFPAGVTPDSTGIFIAGGSEFGAAPNAFELKDDDGDGIYSVTFERGVGFSGYHTFTNGACPDYGCKEDISGQACADPNNFNDRFINAVSADTVINTCFGECSESTDCSTSNLRNLSEGVFTVKPTMVTRFAELTFENTLPKQISVISLSGKVMSVESTNAASFRLDMEGLAAGMYFIRVDEGQRSAIQKVLKQ